jgi:hypothetical protein
MAELMACLTTRGCPDLTSKLDHTKAQTQPSGKGGYSDVWQGTLMDGRAVALKCLRGDEKLLKVRYMLLLLFLRVAY